MKRRVRVSKGRKIARLRASADDGKRTHDLGDDLARFYKPLKKPVTLRLDADVLAWFKKKGRGYQTRINRALRGLMTEQKKESAE